MMTTSNIYVAGKAYPEQESFMEKWLIMPKMLYFMLNMFVYGFHGLMFFIFVKQFQMPYFEFGYATAIIAFNFFGSMMWTSLADRTGRYKLIIIITAILYTVVACIMGLYKKDPNTPHTWLTSTLIYTGFALFNFFLSASFPLLDAQILGKLSQNPNLSKDQFNNQRMWGAFGHYAATLCSFYVYDKHNPISAIYFQLSVSAVFLLLVFIGVEDVKPLKHGHGHHGGSGEKKDGAQPVKNPVVALLTNPSFLFFMAFISCSGIIRSVSSSFQKAIATEVSKHNPFKYTGTDKHEAERHNNFQAAIIDLGRTISEVAIYLLAKPLKNAFGVYWILVLSQIFGIVRVLGYGLLNTNTVASYYFTWGLELMKGFSSGLVSSSAIPIASSIAPAGCEGTAQGLYSGNYSGLSNAFGGILGGGILHALYYTHPGAATKTVTEVDQMLDTKKMYVWVSIGCTVITLGMMAKFIFVDRVMGIPGFPRKHSWAH